MLGDDGHIHDMLVDATSLFDATEQALRCWARLSWFNPNAGLTVRGGPDTWTVSQRQLRAKRAADSRTGEASRVRDTRNCTASQSGSPASRLFRSSRPARGRGTYNEDTHYARIGFRPTM